MADLDPEPADDRRPVVSVRDAAIRRRVILGTSANVLVTGFRLLVWLLLTPFIIDSIGPVSYGLWVLVASLGSYGNILDLGLTPALVKYVAEHVARGDLEGASRVVTTALWLFVTLGVVAFGLALLIAPGVPEFFGVPVDQRATASLVVALTGLTLAIGLPASIAPSTLIGLQRYDVVSAIGAGSTLAGALVTVAVLTLGGGLVGMVAVNIPVVLVTTAVTLVAIRWVRPDLALRVRRPDRSRFRQIASYSSSSFAYQVSSRLQLRTDEMVVGRFLSVALVGPYAIGRRVSELVTLATQQFLRVLLPLASQLDAEGDEGRLRALYLTASRLSMALAFPVGTTVIVLAEPFIVAWVGPRLAGAVPVTVILAISSMIGLSQWSAVAIFQGRARHRPLAVASLITGIANLVLSIVLVQRIGIVGVAVGTLVPTAIESMLFLLPYTTRRLGIPVLQVARECALPALVPLVPSVVVTVALRELVHPSSLPVVGIVGTIGCGIYWVVYILVGAGPLERDLVRRWVVRLRAVRSPRRHRSHSG